MNTNFTEVNKMKKMLLIINPVAGKRNPNTYVVSVIDEFVKGGFDVTVRTTQYAGEIGEIIINCADSFSIIVVSGGDGTLNEAANAVMKCDEKARPKLGYIPSGTVNDFAASHNIPLNPVEAARHIVNNDTKLLDIGMLGERVFVYVAAFGAFTDVSYQTDQQMKNTFGKIAYFFEGIKRIVNIASYKIKLECDIPDEHNGKKNMRTLKINDSFIYGMITNSKTIGGLKLREHEQVLLDDGLMEVTLFKSPKNIQEQQQIINALLSLKADPKVVSHFQTSRIKFISEEPLSWTTDGEFGGTYTNTELTIQRKKFGIII